MRPSKRTFLYFACLLLVFPALFVNLGLMAFIDDEGIRSLVALEMDLSGNYLVPTLHGAPYYNKPPLFNWIMLVFFKVAGVYNEWVARLPTVVALLGFSATVFYYFQKHYRRYDAFLVAAMVLTCGRILFWDALLALIDMTFSWVIFTLFMVIYHRFERRQYAALFLLSYLLTAVGFMLKGLPALVFQATTLLVYFTYRRAFARLFSWAHLAGILLLFALLGTYYAMYHQYHDLGIVWKTLFLESAKRTVVQYGWWETVLHVFAFPFEMVYHFLPWSLLVVYGLRRDLLGLLRADRFQSFLALAFLGNILVYWTSPEVYPRYLLMLAPLIFGNLLFLHRRHEAEKTWAYRLVMGMFLLLCVLSSLAAVLPFVLDRAQAVPFWWLKALVVMALLVGGTLAFYRWRHNRLLAFVAVLLVVRLAFNWFVLPDREANDPGQRVRTSSQRIGAAYRDRPLAVWGETDMQPANSFYLTQMRGAIIPREKDTFDLRTPVIVDPQDHAPLEYVPVDSFFVRHGRRYYQVGLPAGD